MKIKKIVGKKLKAIRLKSDMTIQELAAESGVSSNMISRVERGLTIPSVEILMKLVRRDRDAHIAARLEQDPFLLHLLQATIE